MTGAERGGRGDDQRVRDIGPCAGSKAVAGLDFVAAAGETLPGEREGVAGTLGVGDDEGFSGFETVIGSVGIFIAKK